MYTWKWLDSMLYDGGMGLEEENQRVTYEGFLAKTDHPFKEKGLDRDFCESQLEMITSVLRNVEDVVRAVGVLRKYAASELRHRDSGMEFLWPFSNPPYIRDDNDIHIAQFDGDKAEKTLYRQHLATVYGKRVQTLCGIHFNYSFPSEFIDTLRMLGIDPDIMYLKLAEQLVHYSWLLVALTAASPVYDASFTDSSLLGQTVAGKYSSLRCSERGYWNHFLPVLSFDRINSYISSIDRYVKNGSLYSFSELYYPIRLKPKGVNTLEGLKNGIDHIELRMLDLNPLFREGINPDDLTFIVVFISYLSEQILTERLLPMTPEEQQQSIDNMKSAAHFPLEDIDILYDGRIRSLTGTAIKVLGDVMRWAKGNGADYETIQAIALQQDKMFFPEKRYSAAVMRMYCHDYVETTLAQLKEGKI